MGGRIREKDWSRTLLGAIEAWPQSLRTAVCLALGAPVAAAVAWGPGHVLVHNDEYEAQCRAFHPEALGHSFRACWAAEPDVIDAFERALSGQAVSLEDRPMRIDRDGRSERGRARYTFTPLRDASGLVSGVLHWIVESAQHELARLRADLERERGRLFSMLERAPLAVAITRGLEHRLVFANARLRRMFGQRDLARVTMREMLSEHGQASLEVRDRVYATGESALLREVVRASAGGGDGAGEEVHLDVFHQPDLDRDGQVQGVISLGIDVTEVVLAQRQRDEAHRIAHEALARRARGSLREPDRRGDERAADGGEPSEDADADAPAGPGAS